MFWTPGQGWDRWNDLNRQILPIPKDFQGAPLVHVIVEGAGGADGQMAYEYKKKNPGGHVCIGALCT